MQHAPRIHLIKRLVGEIQMFRIAHGQMGTQAERRESPASVFDGAFGEVNPPEVRAGFGKLLMIRAQSYANLQHPQAPRFLETGKIPDIGFEGIARPRLRCVACQVGIRQIESLAASGLVPELADGFFCMIHEVAPAAG